MDNNVFEKLRRGLIRTSDSVEFHRAQQQQLTSSNQLIHLHYLYDWGPRCQFNEKLKQLWSDLIEKDPGLAKLNLKYKLNTVHYSTLNSLLTQEIQRRINI